MQSDGRSSSRPDCVVPVGVEAAGTEADLRHLLVGDLPALRRLSEQARGFRSAFGQLPKTYPEAEDNEVYSACERYLKLVEDVVSALNERKTA